MTHQVIYRDDGSIAGIHKDVDDTVETPRNSITIDQLPDDYSSQDYVVDGGSLVRL